MSHFKTIFGHGCYILWKLNQKCRRQDQIQICRSQNLTSLLHAGNCPFGIYRDLWQHLFNLTFVSDALTWILGVVSKQLRLLHGLAGDSTTSVNSLSPQMSELVEDAVASWCGDIVGYFWLIRNELQKFVELKFEFFSFNTFDASQIFWQRVIQTRPKYSNCY